ncbi:MAG TPA: peptidase domain-containing ABC transporter [Hellea balneolensis]|uniref:Peptidase domain-containing ABC transporter n=1 Tax=Hellea balneolensis TaxID=287478 RepID=A0A7C3C8W0_9PROT|nr:peptidase domain-containing ABC transporter [Hellea balneolensis]
MGTLPQGTEKLNLFKYSKLPVVLQAEAAECGMACLAMIGGYHGYNVSLQEMRRKFSVSLKGVNLKSLTLAADQLGLSGRALRLDIDDLKQVKTPAILHWGLNHFVVLKNVGRKMVTIHDPAKGKRKLRFEDVSKHFTGIALELTPTPDFEKKDEKDKVKLWDLWSKMTGFMPTIIQIIAITVILQVFAVLSPLVNQLVVDEAIAKGDMSFLKVIIMGFALLLFVQTAIGVLRSYVSMYFGTMLNFQMRSNMLRHVMRLPAEFFEKRHVGDVLSRMGSLKPVQDLFTSAFISILLDGIMAVITFGVMFLYSPMLAGLVVGIIVLSFVVQFATFPYVLRMNEEQIQKSADLQTILLETIRGARAIKIFGREGERHALWQNAYADNMNIGLRLQRFGIASGTASGIVFGLLELGMFYLGGMLVINQELTLGMFFAFQSYRGQFSGRVGSLVGLYFSFRTVGLHLERLADIIHADPEIGIDGPLLVGKQLSGKIEVKDLKFRYGDNEPWVLDGVNLIIEAKDRIGLIGPSGEGKTTLLKLLIGLHTPDEGEILYDGRPLSKTGVRAIRDQIGVVMQDDRLLSGSLYDNISFFDPEMDVERAEMCAKAAYVYKDIMDMPMGFQSLIGDMGSILSGGQKQRVLLARALYHNPKILFLDEGTANLDPQTELKVVSILDKLPITQITVAHRAAAIQNCNRIFHVENGQVREVDKAANTLATTPKVPPANMLIDAVWRDRKFTTAL